VTSSSYLKNLEFRENEGQGAVTNPWFFSGNLTSIILENANEKTPDISGEGTSTSLSYTLTTREILEKSNLMLLESGNITRTHINEYLNSQGIYPNQILEINNMDLLIDFASIGMGVAGVVREFATEPLNSGQIIELPIDTPIKERTVGFVYSNSKAKPQSLSKFIEFCNLTHIS
jgi:hypothetical protein